MAQINFYEKALHRHEGREIFFKTIYSTFWEIAFNVFGSVLTIRLTADYIVVTRVKASFSELSLVTC